MKKFITIFLALFLVSTSAHATGVIREATYPEHFSDIADNEIYHESTSYLYEEGIIKGYADGTFKPENKINRAELLKVIIESTWGTPPQDHYKNCFSDVKEEWFAPYVCYAKEQQIIMGYTDNTFKPGNNVSKAEAIKMLLEGYPLEIFKQTSMIFNDVTATEWFADYVFTAAVSDLLADVEGANFNPNSAAIRGDISDNIYRIQLMIENRALLYTPTDAITSDDWIKGNLESDVIFIKYGDFQCPACAVAYETLRDIIYPEFNEQVAFIYRYFPLTSTHSYAEPAARAAESAGMMGKFWEMHDMLYENQEEWVGSAEPDQLFVTYAQEIGLDPETFENYYRAYWMKARIEGFRAAAQASGINATPQFFINGSLLSGSQPVENFRQAILDAF